MWVVRQFLALHETMRRKRLNPFIHWQVVSRLAFAATLVQRINSICVAVRSSKKLNCQPPMAGFSGFLSRISSTRRCKSPWLACLPAQSFFRRWKRAAG